MWEWLCCAQWRKSTETTSSTQTWWVRACVPVRTHTCANVMRHCAYCIFIHCSQEMEGHSSHQGKYLAPLCRDQVVLTTVLQSVPVFHSLCQDSGVFLISKVRNNCVGASGLCQTVCTWTLASKHREEATSVMRYRSLSMLVSWDSSNTFYMPTSGHQYSICQVTLIRLWMLSMMLKTGREMFTG